ncbi:MAG: hypothetical protein J5915_07445 [Acidaminococcaceae bacterium]|nr:hypothetical protein [Acidaminococcaceae bacterium]
MKRKWKKNLKRFCFSFSSKINKKQFHVTKRKLLIFDKTKDFYNVKSHLQAQDRCRACFEGAIFDTPTENANPKKHSKSIFASAKGIFKDTLEYKKHV